MPMMPVTEALRTTPKGRLVYNTHVQLDEVSPPPLTRYHHEKESPRLNGTLGLCSPDPNDSIKSLDDFLLTVKNCDISDDNSHSNISNSVHVQLTDSQKRSPNENSDLGVSNSSNEQNVEKRQESIHQDSPNVEKLLSSSPLSPEWYSNQAIIAVEAQYSACIKRSHLEHCKKFNEHDKELSSKMRGRQQDALKRIKHLKEKRKSSIERRQQEEKEKANKTLNSLKENHEKHKEKIDTKQKEIEQQRLDLEREQEKKQEEYESKLQVIKTCMSQVEESRATFNQMYENFPHKELFPEAVDKWKVMLDKVCTVLSAKIQKEAHPEGIPDELVAVFQSHAEKRQVVVNNLRKQIEDIESQLKRSAEKKKEEETKQAEDKKKAEIAKKEETAAAQECGVQALSYALKTRKSKTELLAKIDASLKAFVTNTDPQIKQYRFDLQRAVNTPINAISGVDSHHLRDKLHRLLALLRGQEVRMGNKVIRADRTPEALLFCQNLVAKMLVRKGEEQVSSLSESAFPIAAVILGLWCEFPIVGDMFLAHLQALCPYVLPYYHAHQQGETVVEYHRSLGYKVDEDGTVEEQDKFLRRMSGLMRLYCACLVTAPPPPTPGGATKPPQGRGHFPHPHGLENGWMWLARCMDQDPHPDISANLIYEVLVFSGSHLLRQYSVQFVKMVYLLYKQYLPRLKEVAVTSATLGRLEIFLESALKSARIPEPEGQLRANFWFS